MVNERIEARIDEVQGNEQGELREKLRRDCSLESLILNEFEMNEHLYSVELLTNTIKGCVIDTLNNLIALSSSKLNKNAIPEAIDGEMDEIKKDLAGKFDATFDDFTTKEEYQTLINKYVERVIDRKEQERFL